MNRNNNNNPNANNPNYLQLLSQVLGELVIAFDQDETPHDSNLQNQQYGKAAYDEKEGKSEYYDDYNNNYADYDKYDNYKGAGKHSKESSPNHLSKRSFADHQAVGNHLQKTKLCQYFMKGNCRNRQNCPFAHGVEDLSKKPDLSKTSWCRRFLDTGLCPGIATGYCTFAHTAEEFRDTMGYSQHTRCRFFDRGMCLVGEKCNFLHEKVDTLECTEVPKRDVKNSKAAPSSGKVNKNQVATS